MEEIDLWRAAAFGVRASVPLRRSRRTDHAIRVLVEHGLRTSENPACGNPVAKLKLLLSDRSLRN
jgi:hypothetical protein